MIPAEGADRVDDLIHLPQFHIKTASSMLVHFSAGFNLDTYAHVATSAQKEAAQTMGNVPNL